MRAREWAREHLLVLDVGDAVFGTARQCRELRV
jgi:hypothetical protein